MDVGLIITSSWWMLLTLLWPLKVDIPCDALVVQCMLSCGNSLWVSAPMLLMVEIVGAWSNWSHCQSLFHRLGNILLCCKGFVYYIVIRNMHLMSPWPAAQSSVVVMVSSTFIELHKSCWLFAWSGLCLLLIAIHLPIRCICHCALFVCGKECLVYRSLLVQLSTCTGLLYTHALCTFASPPVHAIYSHPNTCQMLTFVFSQLVADLFPQWFSMTIPHFWHTIITLCIW